MFNRYMRGRTVWSSLNYSFDILQQLCVDNVIITIRNIEHIILYYLAKTLYVILEANIDTFYRAKKEKKPDWLEETPEHEKEE